MDEVTARRLIELNNSFYRANAESFSRTRQGAWAGWERACKGIDAPRRVLDIACGNMRFKTFLLERFANAAIAPEYHAIDSCEDLLANAPRATFQRLDLLSPLIDRADLSTLVNAPACDLVACFGFMHHVPTAAARGALLDFLVDKTVRAGRTVVSFWQFARDQRALVRARETTERGCAQLGLQLDEGDFLIGWNNLAGTYRYCHSFTDREIDALEQRVSSAALVVDRFRADGKTGESNGYLVLRRL